jgi:hypothetical protein
LFLEACEDVLHCYHSHTLITWTLFKVIIIFPICWHHLSVNSDGFHAIQFMIPM